MKKKSEGEKIINDSERNQLFVLSAQLLSRCVWPWLGNAWISDLYTLYCVDLELETMANFLACLQRFEISGHFSNLSFPIKGIMFLSSIRKEKKQLCISISSILNYRSVVYTTWQFTVADRKVLPKNEAFHYYVAISCWNSPRGFSRLDGHCKICIWKFRIVSDLHTELSFQVIDVYYVKCFLSKPDYLKYRVIIVI